MNKEISLDATLVNCFNEERIKQLLKCDKELNSYVKSLKKVIEMKHRSFIDLKAKYTILCAEHAKLKSLNLDLELRIKEI
jgi:hypothetical protein